MKPRPVIDEDLEAWGEGATITVYGPPLAWDADRDGECGTVEAVVHDGQVSVAWVPDEEDLAALANGGTVWVTVRGTLPVHSVAVA